MTGTEMSLLEFIDHLPKTHRIRAEMASIANTICLLNSMIYGGEQHSDYSKKEVTESLSLLRKY